MASNRDLGAFLGKAKKWAQQEMKNATKIGGDPREHHAAQEENDDLKRHLELEANEMAQAAALEAVLPQSLKDYRDHVEADRVQRRTESEAAAREQRLARVTDSVVTLTGAVTGSASGLAVETWTGEDNADLFVSVELVDAVKMVGGTVTGFCFRIPGYHGVGTYRLVDEDLDGTQYELYLSDDDNEGWGFHPSFGPGVITVADGVADVKMVLGGAGNDTIDLTARITLGSVR